MTDQTPASQPRATSERSTARQTFDAAADAIRFFTRLSLPAEWGSTTPRAMARGIAAGAPFAGLIVGAAAGAALALGLAVGLPEFAAATLSAAIGLAVSGVLHLDGLADMADGFGGGGTRERKLEIMRDSRIGSYGGAALALALIMRIALVAGLAERLGPSGAFAGLIACAALSRPLAFAPILMLDPARIDGLSQSTRPETRSIATGLAIGALFCLAFGGPGAGAVALIAGTIGALGVTALARAEIGGHTGDVCGAAAEIGELFALAALVAVAA